MPRKGILDRAALADLLAEQHGLITRSQTISCRMSDAMLRHRLRPEGPWQVLLPTVYQASTGRPTREQREFGALLYAGKVSVITGPAALVAHGIAIADRRGITLDQSHVDVLIPADRKRSDYGFVRVIRTGRMPGMVHSAAGIRYVPPVRAVADTVRRLTDLREVRAVVASAVQWRSLSVSELAAELDEGPVKGSANFRAALLEAREGIRSVAESDLRKLVKRYGLPDPLYNPRLFLGEEFVAKPDAWWGDAGVAVEVDSREWHISPRDWELTMARHSRMSALGIIVLHYPPRRLTAQPGAIAGEISSALAAGRGRELPALRAVPA